MANSSHRKCNLEADSPSAISSMRVSICGITRLKSVTCSRRCSYSRNWSRGMGLVVRRSRSRVSKGLRSWNLLLSCRHTRTVWGQEYSQLPSRLFPIENERSRRSTAAEPSIHTPAPTPVSMPLAPAMPLRVDSSAPLSGGPNRWGRRGGGACGDRSRAGRGRSGKSRCLSGR